MKALSYGEILWDIIHDKELIGGAPFNVAAHLAKQGCQSAIYSSVGTDARGDKALTELKRLGVNATFVQRDTHPTGVALVHFSGLGIASYEFPEAAFDHIQTNESALSQIRKQNFDVFCFGTLAQRAQTSRETLYRILDDHNRNAIFQEVFFDINIRLDFYPLEVIQPSLRHATIVKLNDEEARLISQLLYGEDLPEARFAEQLQQDYALKLVMITKGAQGCSVYDNTNRFDVEGNRVQVVDTVGSGDSFSAAFLRHYLTSGDAKESACLGNLVGSFVATQTGAIPEYSQEIEDVLHI